MEGFLEERTSEFSLKGPGLTGAEGQETPPLVAGRPFKRGLCPTLLSGRG